MVHYLLYSMYAAPTGYFHKEASYATGERFRGNCPGLIV